VKFEVVVYRNEAGEWVASAVEYDVSAKGLSEKEALARIMEALAVHFKQKPAR
jgi:predicted RNase H-like HicB family nuclease